MSEISSVSLECRDMRHAWYKASDNIVIRDGNLVRHFRRRIACERCEAVREEDFKVSYARNNRVVAVELVRRRYSYPDGYVVKGGLKTNDARAILFQELTFIHEDD